MRTMQRKKKNSKIMLHERGRVEFSLYLCVPSRAREMTQNETQKKNLY